ncbi:MAG: radical SAM family heme chaperone HemW [Bacteroidaceae bacterium]
MCILVSTRFFIKRCATEVVAGLYIHVPFCKGRCIYCDFYSTTEGAEWKSQYVSALLQEIRQRRHELSYARVHSIYIGGGTPSQLPPDMLAVIFREVFALYSVDSDAEVTVEANPDDVTAEWLSVLRHTPVNRLSMGIQTFDDALLRLLRRRHTSEQAVRAVEKAHSYGFDNVSIDLIYGLPGQTMAQWQYDVRQGLALGIQHLSAYALSYEEGTPLERMLRQGEMKETDEELSLRMYEYLMDAAKVAGFLHYEISNFSLPGRYSRHNSAYWQGTPYLGLGPGAHSYDGARTRRWNLSDLRTYVNAADGMPPYQNEILTDNELYDELVMTRLRTIEGLSLDLLQDQDRTYCLEQAQPHLRAGRMVQEGNFIHLTRKGIFTSNDIISDLMKT